MRFAVLLSLFAALLAVRVAQADDDLGLQFEPHAFTASDGAPLFYRWLAPRTFEPGRKYPLVIFLHGAGERGDDNLAQLKHGVKIFASEEFRQEFPCFVIAPQCPAGKRWSEVDWSSPTPEFPPQTSDAMQRLIELIDRTERELPVDADRLYVTGLSMGGYGSFDLVLRQPQRFAAAVPVCGGVDVELLARVKHVPFWLFHGAKDGVVPPERSREAVAALQAAGGSPKYTEYPDVGHDSWNGAYSDREMFRWMFAQKRGAAAE